MTNTIERAEEFLNKERFTTTTEYIVEADNHIESLLTELKETQAKLERGVNAVSKLKGWGTHNLGISYDEYAAIQKFIAAYKEDK